ncbi:hypothetical protein LBMAG42_25880 [Deltaproteobacteria bacterium]|nr:hypothetical protein LBMAG42_25880 [Deltaproteobacteria bacterium]
MWRSLVLLTLMACAEPTAPASVSVANDERLATLPLDSTLVASIDLPALAAGSGVVSLLREAGMDPAPLLALAEVGAGVEGFRVRDARLGCGGSGCVALLEGGFTPAGVERATDAVADAVADAEAERASVANGDWVLRRLSAQKAVFGDREAVREVWEAVRSGAPGLDVAALEGRVPDGGLWVLVRDVERFEAQAAARAGAVRPDGAARVHAGLARARTQLPSLDRVETLAASVSATGLLHARAVCADEAAAMDLELRLGAAGLEAKGLEGVAVSRSGATVEVTGHPRSAAIATLFGVAE